MAAGQHDEDEGGSEGREGRPNKSQQKRDTQALRGLVKRLMSLADAALRALPLDEQVREAVVAARRMDRGALARQMRYTIGLMRDQDIAALEAALDAMVRPHRREVQSFQEVEGWRDALLEGDEGLCDRLADRLGADRRYLRQLMRNARREREHNSPPKSARLIFKYLMELRTVAGGDPAPEED